MVQVKKADVRDAILDSAITLFSRKGYAKTTISEIAADAGHSTSNIYVYFPSKLDVLWAVMSPWLEERFTALEQEIDRIETPRARVEHMLRALWHDIPTTDNNLAANLLQGLALSEPEDNYNRDLLFRLERRLSAMLLRVLPPERRTVLGQRDAFAHLLMMAFDGFVLGARVHGPSARMDAIVDVTADILLGDSPRGGTDS